MAFRVDAAKREPVVRYLREREQVTAVYLERMAPIILESGERVLALTYVADRQHLQYAGRLDRGRMLAIVRRGSGRSGPNSDYVTETFRHLLEMGVRDRDLEWLSSRLNDLGKIEPEAVGSERF
jgi:cation transport protein ChaC